MLGKFRWCCWPIHVYAVIEQGKLSCQLFDSKRCNSTVKRQPKQFLYNTKFSYVSNVSLTSIPEGLFQGLSHLRNVYVCYEIEIKCSIYCFSDLSYNQLTSLPEGLFKGLSNLEVMYVYNLTCSRMLSFCVLVILTIICYPVLLQEFSMGSICPQCTYNLSFVVNQCSVSVFSFLDNNQLTSVPEGLFTGLSDLQEMYVLYLSFYCLKTSLINV